MKPKAWWAVSIVLVVAGIALAAGTAVYWLTPQQGQYSGPGIPYTSQTSFTLSGDGAWHAQGFTVSGAQYNMTECFNESSNPPVLVWTYFMNQTQYDEFNVNSTLTYLGNQSVPGCFGPYHYDNGPGPLYWVYVDTSPQQVQVQSSITVGVDVAA
jgi:hypothetical protein